MVGGVDADVGDKEVEQAVTVVVEEDGAGRVSDVVHAGLLTDVAKAPLAVVFEEHVALLTVVTKRSGSPSLSMSANEAETPSRSARRNACASR